MFERMRILASNIDIDRTRAVGINAETIKELEKIRYFQESSDNSRSNSLDLSAPTLTNIFFDDVDLLVASGCIAEAEAILYCLLDENAQCVKAIRRLAELYEIQSDYSQTVQFTKHLLIKQGYNPEAGYQLAFALYKLGMSDHALEYILPYYISDPSQRVSRLCGLLLKSLGRTEEAIDVLAIVIKDNPADIHSIRALSEIYVYIGMYSKALEILHLIPGEKADLPIKLYEAIIYRFMGEIDHSINLHDQLLEENPGFIDVLWPQCFNYSIFGPSYSDLLIARAKQYWHASGYLNKQSSNNSLGSKMLVSGRRRQIGILTADIGEHVVSRFLAPLLRGYCKDDFEITLLSTVRRFEQKGLDIAACADHAISLQEHTLDNSRSLIAKMNLDIILDTNGFTKNSGLPILAKRCAPIQGHYIGYHASTGLETIDYFLGDSTTTPPSFQSQFTEELIQIPRLWMGYDSTIHFPLATTTSKRESPVLGAFSQITKINSLTLQYWSAAMRAVPESILVIKDRGVQCQISRQRIEQTMLANGVDSDRIYFIGPVGTHADHLDSYNAIDIALDTTPWSGATTAFEALGMGVPLVAICGNTTSGRMSTSVVRAAGMNHMVAESIDEFASIVENLCKDHQWVRENKRDMQRQIRQGILFDENRICTDFFKTIDKIIGM